MCKEKEPDTNTNYLRSSNTGNIFLQLVVQHCCFTSCKALLPVLPPPQATCRATNFSVASCSNMLQQVGCAGGNMGNKALQLVKQQCCVTIASCKEMLPVLLGLYSPFNHMSKDNLSIPTSPSKLSAITGPRNVEYGASIWFFQCVGPLTKNYTDLWANILGFEDLH